LKTIKTSDYWHSPGVSAPKSGEPTTISGDIKITTDASAIDSLL